MKIPALQRGAVVRSLNSLFCLRFFITFQFRKKLKSDIFGKWRYDNEQNGTQEDNNQTKDQHLAKRVRISRMSFARMTLNKTARTKINTKHEDTQKTNIQ